MSIIDTNNLNPDDNGKGNEQHNEAQRKKIFEALKVKPMTMKEIECVTGIQRSNVCWLLAPLRDSELVKHTRNRKCTISSESGVMEFTANQDLFPRSNQLKLFDL